MKKRSLIGSLLITSALFIGCSDISNVAGTDEKERTTGAIGATDTELAIEKEAAFRAKRSRAANISDINYLTSYNDKGYTSSDETNWTMFTSNVTSVSGGVDGIGNFYTDKEGEIHHNGYTTFGDFTSVAYCAYTKDSYAIDKNGDIWKRWATEWYASYDKMTNKPGNITSIDVDGYGRPWVVVDSKIVYKLNGSVWEEMYTLNTTGSYASIMDIGVGDYDTYLVIACHTSTYPRPMNWSIVAELNRSQGTITDLGNEFQFARGVDVASEGTADCLWMVGQGSRYGQDALWKVVDGKPVKIESASLNGRVQNLGCSIYW